jgi:hypothetical protein
VTPVWYLPAFAAASHGLAIGVQHLPIVSAICPPVQQLSVFPVQASTTVALLPEHAVRWQQVPAFVVPLIPVQTSWPGLPPAFAHGHARLVPSPFGNELDAPVEHGLPTPPSVYAEHICTAPHVPVMPDVDVEHTPLAQLQSSFGQQLLSSCLPHMPA